MARPRTGGLWEENGPGLRQEDTSKPQPTARRSTMTTNLKLKLVGLGTTIALIALPVADALAAYRGG
jgi:hypothetical protein